MARATNAMITFTDLNYMITNNGFRQKISFSNSSECMTKAEIEARAYIYITDELTRTSNRLVPYQKIIRGLYVSAPSTITTAYPAQSFTFDLEVDGLWSISDNASWITVSPSSGEDNQSGITVSLTQNTGGGARTGVITVSSETGQSYTITITQNISSGADTDPISLGYHSSNAEDACLDYVSSPFTYYMEDGKNFYTNAYMFANAAGTVKAAQGWYSNGTDSRFWNTSLDQFTAQTPCLEP